MPDTAATVPIKNARRAAYYAYLAGMCFGIGMTAFVWWLS